MSASAEEVSTLTHGLPSNCSICQYLVNACTTPSHNDPWGKSFAPGTLLTAPCSGHGKLFTKLRQIADRKNRPKHKLDLNRLDIRHFANMTGLYFSLSGSSTTILQNIAVLNSGTEANWFGGQQIADRSWIDPALPRLWKDRCHKNHGEDCERPLKAYSLPTVTPTWLLDVHNLRLVPGRPGARYVTLSYRWGQTAGLQLQNALILEFQKPHALFAHLSQIPDTIRNAIDVVKLLGESYMWVDSLCISQDDNQIKTREIDSMGAIYANATMTIVAADGEDANYGLRGLEGLSKERDMGLEDIFIDFGEEHKLVNLDHVYGTGRWAESSYFTRGWVFQEFHFSKRRLIFQNQMVRWECCCSRWQEVFRPSDGMSSFRHHFGTALEFGYPSLSVCASLIADYNNRNFTYTADALPAVTGLLAILGQKFFGGFLYGLPEMYFEAALNWDVEKGWNEVNEMRRRVHAGPSKVEDQQLSLPSWSWIGWKGRFGECSTDEDYTITSTYSRVYTIPITEWFTSASLYGPRRRINSWFLRDRDHFKDHMNHPLPQGWSRDTCEASIQSPEVRSHFKNEVVPCPPPNGCGSAVYTHKSLPQINFWYPFPIPEPGEAASSPPQTNYLFCNTHRFYFSIDLQTRDPPTRSPRAAYLRTSSGQFAGALFYQSALDRNDMTAKKALGQTVEVVATSRGYLSEIRGLLFPIMTEFEVRRHSMGAIDEDGDSGWEWVVIKEWYNVLWVEWKDGIAYRRCLGRILKDVWEAQDLKPISLVLG